MGSWKIMESRSPRSARRSGPERARRSRPSKRMAPAEARTFSGSSPITARAVSDLPEPDSPTTQTISPSSMEKDASSTA